jgi:pSer/pThr/pTyr-binding forkhead associated (FHA) protein
MLTSSVDIKEQINTTVEKLRAANPSFESAYDTYTQQYGKDAVNVNKPINLVNTIDPVTLVFGRNTPIHYSDSNKTIHGSLGSVKLSKGLAYLIGRREPQDSNLVIWGPQGIETDLERYNAEAGVIPSRIHAALVFRNDEQVLFTDLGSSSGTIIVGDSKQRGAFTLVYDPGTNEYPRVRFERINTNRIV